MNARGACGATRASESACREAVKTSISSGVSASWTKRPETNANAVAPTDHTSERASTSWISPSICSGAM
jgi:hypothetical protein